MCGARTTHNQQTQPLILNGMVDGFGGQLLLMRAKFQVRHIFSIKINMGTGQQYDVGEGEVFSISDL
jgi:hypothetical protein